MKKSGDPFGRPATKGRSSKSPASKKGKDAKLSTLTSSATDEDFYSSLAEMAGDNFDDDDSMTEQDAKNLADTLAGMDDLDSDLFGDSLGRKPVTKKVSSTSSATASAPNKNKPSTTDDKSEGSSSKAGKKFDISKYDSLDFNEDDPLAGILSDEEDGDTKAKAHKKGTTKKPPIKKEPQPTFVAADLERPKTSSGIRRQQQDSHSLGHQSPSLPPKDIKTENTQKTASPKADKFSDRVSSPVKSQDGSLAFSPRQKGQHSPLKPKHELSFDSGDVLPGIDESPRPTPRNEQSPEQALIAGQTLSTRQTSGTSSRRKDQKAKAENDLFGDDDSLFGLDEGKSPTKQISNKPSRFNELLGGKKEKNESKPQKPKSLDDFMSNISSGSKNPSEVQPGKVPNSKDENESFQFGGYTPSAFGGPAHPGSRPDTAPGKRSVRFADELGLDDDLLGVSRPSTAPTTRKQTSQKGLGGRQDPGGLSFDEDLSKEKPAKESKSGSDWLGLGSEDPGLELDLPSYKPSTVSKTVAKEPENEAPAQQKPSSEDTKARWGRDQGDAEGDDFLKMLGITPDDSTTQKSPLDGSAHRGRRWRDQITNERDSMDLSSSFAGKMKPSSKTHEKMQSKGTKESEALARSVSPDHNQTVLDQKVPTLSTTALHQKGTSDQLSGLTSERALPREQQNIHKDTLETHSTPIQHPSQTMLNTSPSYMQQKQLQSTNQAQTLFPQGQASTIPHYQSTPTYVPQGSPLITSEKTQMEREMQELIKRLHVMEGSSQKQQIDGAGYVAQLESKVRRLEMEVDHLQTTLDSMKTRHTVEMANTETSNKAYIRTLEESYQLRETRIKEENDLQTSHYKDRIRALEEEKSAIQAAHLRKVQSLESSGNSEVERVKDLHRKAIEKMKQDHDEELVHLRKLKEQEVSVATSAHDHTKSLQSLMQQVLNSTKDVNDMRFQIEATHKSSITERELAAKARDEHLTQLQERLLKQQAENDEERARLQGLIAKMEVHMREQTRQVDQERWRLTQEESRIKALQSTLEDERRYTMEQLAVERAEVHRSREELLRQQKKVTTELQEERRNVSLERAQLSSAHKEIITREKYKNDSAIQAEAELETTASKIKEDAAALGVRQAQLKQEEEALAREKRDFKLRQEKFEEEKDRIGLLSLEVQRRSEEIGELCAEGAKARKDGEGALARADALRRETENEKAELENRLILLQEKEKQLAQDRVSIAHERRVLETDKRNGRCGQCEASTTGSPFLNTDLSDARNSSTPFISAIDSDTPSQSPSRTLGTPDLLLNSLELKRNLRKWTNEKERDEEFLEQESMFLNQLRKSRGSTKKRLSMTS